METQAPDTAGFYRRWGAQYARGSSPTYEALCEAVADSPTTMALLDELPPEKRQPNLFFGALRFTGAELRTPGDAARALEFFAAHTGAVRAVMTQRRTQTNEVARCAVLLPALAAIAGPVVLVEVGTSAGLCLLYDRWAYRYLLPDGAEQHVGDSEAALTLECEVRGGALPALHVPTITERVGLDLAPVDPAGPGAARWLEALVWPEHTQRAARLRTALAVAAADPPALVSGTIGEDLPPLLEQIRSRAAAEATVVVTHSLTLAYLDPPARRRFAADVAAAGAVRVGLESAEVSADLGADVPPSPRAASEFVVTRNAELLAHTDPHGAHLTWRAGTAR